ncbi:MAG: response regulator transcription factor [Longimicrobiales bacterium]
MTGAAAATAEIWLHDESELGMAVRDVARRMVGALDAVRGRREGVVREVRLADAAYRVRGAVLDQAESSQPAIVVMLERVDELPSAEAIRSAFGLTGKEVGVARLLAEGLTNAELAEALTISPHTARHHTESVLGKLKVGSRRAVRDRLAEAAYAVN